jgi:hypothetical protein
MEMPDARILSSRLPMSRGKRASATRPKINQTRRKYQPGIHAPLHYFAPTAWQRPVKGQDYGLSLSLGSAPGLGKTEQHLRRAYFPSVESQREPTGNEPEADETGG